MKLIGRRLKSRWATIALFLAVIGPGIITANVDNDAGGIATYSLAGARFGYTFLWAVIPVTIALIVVQEMCARMGAVTGKGLSDLIRENFGLRMTFWLMLGLVICNFGNTLAEFAGVASACAIFGISKYYTVPIAAGLVWWVVVKGDYRTVEKVFLVACTVYLSYIISGFMAHPNWGEMGKAMVTPHWEGTPAYLAMLIGVVGTTIAPWMQFYQQAAVVDKGLRAKDYKFVLLDVVVGCMCAVIVVFFIVATCAATIHAAKIPVVSEDVVVLARALGPLAGNYAKSLFAFGLLNASLFAACILPLATAYQVSEGMGWERGVNHGFRAAPQFYTLYTTFIVLGAGLILIPKAPLLTIMYLSQVLNGMLLPVVLIFILQLINNSKLMGSYKNTRLYNVVSVTITVVMICLTLALLLSTIFPRLMGG